MIELLKTVYGAVATKDIVPVLTNFCLYKSLFDKVGRIQGGNGILCIDAPFEHPVSQCTVKADKFIKAIEACKGTPVFDLTPTGKLSVKAGRFKAYLSTLPASDYPVVSQEGIMVDLKPNFISALKAIKPFISEDASRVWSTSILFSGGYIYATNNVIVARVPYELDYEFDVILPTDTVTRILDIGEMPTLCYIADTSMTLEYGKMWLRTQLTNARWPNVTQFFDEFALNVPVPDDLRDAVERVRDFCANEKFPVIKLGETVSTDSAEEGAHMDGFALPESSFHADQLVKVLSVATHIDFSTYPKPCLFKGNDIEGLIVGIRTEG